MSMESQLDAKTNALIDAADAREADEAAARPDEPSLPLGEWMRKNLFATATSSVMTFVFLTIALGAFRGILNFVFSENRNWDAVRVNMRSLFTFAYQSEQYVRIWFGLGVVMVLTGLTLGLLKTIGRGFSLKRVAIWCLTWGGMVLLGILFREPSVLKNDDGTVRRFEDDGPDSGFFETIADISGVWFLLLIVVALLIGLLIDAVDGPDSKRVLLPAIPAVIGLLGIWISATDADGPRPIRESFMDAMVDRGWWWFGALLAIAIGAALWFGLGDYRRRNTFIPAIPLFLGLLGLFISTVWWYNWGHYGVQPSGDLTFNPGRTVADTTKTPWTVIWVLLVAGYLLGRLLYRETSDERNDSSRSIVPVILAAIGAIVALVWFFRWDNYDFALDGRSRWLLLLLPLAGVLVGRALATSPRAVVNTAWLLAPFTMFFVVFRDPALDYSHLWSTHLPMALGFMIVGGLLLWALTRPGIGEAGRLIATGLMLFAAYNWTVAFFGYDGPGRWDGDPMFLLEPFKWVYNSIIAPIFSGHFIDRFGWLEWIWNRIVSIVNAISPGDPLNSTDGFGFTHMLQKSRISFLLLGLAALAAPNFIGERKQRMRLVLGWVALIAVLHYLITMINTTETVNAPGEGFAGGFMITIFIALFTMIFSFPLGVLLALARTSTLPIFRVLSTVYIEVVRGVPLITILFFFSTFLPIFLPEGMHIAALAGVGVGFSLFSAAYLAENVRGGLQAIRRGQYEASDAVGLTTAQRTAFIVLPQALRVSIPPLVGMAIATFKETSLLAIIGLFDFLRVANNAIPGQTEFLGIKREGLLFVSVIYWIGSYAMSKYSQRLEKQLGVGER